MITLATAVVVGLIACIFVTLYDYASRLSTNAEMLPAITREVIIYSRCAYMFPVLILACGLSLLKKDKLNKVAFEIIISLAWLLRCSGPWLLFWHGRSREYLSSIKPSSKKRSCCRRSLFIGNTDIHNHHAFYWMIHPIRDGIITDDFDLQRPERFVFLGKIAFYERIFRQRPDELQNSLTLSSALRNRFQQLEMQIDSITRVHEEASSSLTVSRIRLV